MGSATARGTGSARARCRSARRARARTPCSGRAADSGRAAPGTCLGRVAKLAASRKSQSWQTRNAAKPPSRRAAHGGTPGCRWIPRRCAARARAAGPASPRPRAGARRARARRASPPAGRRRRRASTPENASACASSSAATESRQPLRRVGVVRIHQRDGLATGERQAAVERDVRARHWPAAPASPGTARCARTHGSPPRCRRSNRRRRRRARPAGASAPPAMSSARARKRAWLYAGITTEIVPGPRPPSAWPRAARAFDDDRCRPRIAAFVSRTTSSNAGGAGSGVRRAHARRAHCLEVARPWRASGSRWLPSAHSFQALTNSEPLVAAATPPRVCRTTPRPSAEELRASRRRRPCRRVGRRAVLSHVGITPRNCANAGVARAATRSPARRVARHAAAERGVESRHARVQSTRRDGRCGGNSTAASKPSAVGSSCIVTSRTAAR